MKKLLVFIPILLVFFICLTGFVIHNQVKPYLPFTNFLLGKNSPTKYLILLQNDTELRANGGFIGSFATASLDSTKSNFPKISLDFQDIYVPDGQITDHITPPAPIDQAFKHGTWRLANADWEPDFPTSAKTIAWFFDKAKVGQFDIIVTLPLTVIRQIVDIVGPFSVPQYQAKITPDNLYAFLQNQAETNFFPGSTQKKDALHATGLALFEKLKHLNPIQYYRLYQVILSNLQNKNILAYSSNSGFQKFLVDQDFAGVLSPGPSDTFSLNESNLGANKANCCIHRLSTHQISKTNNYFTHQIRISLENRSTLQNPNPPFNFSGNYSAYLRLYLPQDAWNINLTHHETTVSSILLPSTPVPQIQKKYGLTEIGFFHTTAAGSTSTIDLSYNLSTISSQFPYSLTLLKQHGLISSPQEIKFNQKIFSTDLTSDFTLIP